MISAISDILTQESFWPLERFEWSGNFYLRNDDQVQNDRQTKFLLCLIINLQVFHTQKDARLVLRNKKKSFLHILIDIIGSRH